MERGNKVEESELVMGEQGENLLFVVGQYKSGSTWLVNLLSAHPWIRGLSETNVIRYAVQKDPITRTIDLYTKTAWCEGGMPKLFRHRMAKWFGPILQPGKKRRAPSERPNTLLDLSIWDQMLLKRKLLQAESKEEFCREFFSFLYQRVQPKRYLVEKTPNNIHFVPFIRSVFPKAKLMSIYRDGRDVVVSEKCHKSRLGKDTWTMEGSARTWSEAIDAQLEYADKYDIFAVSYEELLSNGSILVGKMLEFLDIATDAETNENMLGLCSIKSLTGRNEGQENQKSFYRKGVSGDWMNHFAEDDKAVFKAVTGNRLMRLGYERNDSW